MRADKVALGVAVLSIVLNIYLIVDRPRSTSAAEPSSSQAQLDQLGQELQQLRARVDHVGRTVAFGAPAAQVPEPQPEPPQAAVIAPTPLPSGDTDEHSQAYVEFHVPSSAVHVSQGSTSTLVVTNIDPS